MKTIDNIIATIMCGGVGIFVVLSLNCCVDPTVLAPLESQSKCYRLFSACETYCAQLDLRVHRETWPVCSCGCVRKE